MQRILANIFRIRFARIISRYLADTSRYIFASLRPGSTAPFEEISQRERAVGNTLFDLTGPRFELQTSHSRDERVTARPTDRLIIFEMFYYNKIKPTQQTWLCRACKGLMRAVQANAGSGSLYGPDAGTAS